ncbi:MAG: ATP-binding protein [Moorella sp. (in: Bacteria)]|nr:ATP-binding protein [Moorella sp. (in: firmicutes)]
MFKKPRKEKPTEQPDMFKNAMRIQDTFCPDGLQVGYNFLRLGTDRLCRVYAVQALPRRVQVGWLDEIFRAGDVEVSVHFQPASDGEVIPRLTKKEAQARAQYELDSRAGNISRLPELEGAIADYRALRDAIQLGNDRLYYVTVLIAVHGVHEEELRQRCGVVEDVLARKGVLSRVLAARQAEGIKSVLPTGTLKIRDFAKNLTSGAAACCLPITVSGAGHATGAAVGHNLFTGSLVFLDRFAGKSIIPNPHLFISGETGAGKSVTLRLLSLLEADLGVKTAFVDPENENVHFVKETGGQNIFLEPGRFSGMNVLEVDVETDEKGALRVNVLDKIADVQGWLAAVFRYNSGKGLEMRELALIEEALRELYREKGITDIPESLYEGGVKKPMPTLTDLQKRLAQKPGAQELADSIKPLLSGGSLGMFDGQTTLRLVDAPFIGFHLKAIGSDFARFVAVFAVLSWLWQKFAQKGGYSVKKCVAVDEAWMFLRHPDVAMHLEILARRGRKHGCALTVATQRFEEFASSEAGRAVIESCATILVLRQEEHAADAAVDYFKLSGGCRDLLANAKAGAGILRIAGATTAVQISPAPFEWPLVETRVGG